MTGGVGTVKNVVKSYAEDGGRLVTVDAGDYVIKYFATACLGSDPFDSNHRRLFYPSRWEE